MTNMKTQPLCEYDVMNTTILLLIEISAHICDILKGILDCVKCVNIIILRQ